MRAFCADCDAENDIPIGAEAFRCSSCGVANRIVEIHINREIKVEKPLAHCEIKGLKVDG